MKEFISKLKYIFAAVAGVAIAAFLLFKDRKDKPLPDDEFPLADEKKAVALEVSQLKEEIEKLGQKEYSDSDIEKKFNDK